MKRKMLSACVAVIALTASFSAAAQNSPTLAKVKARGLLHCGVNIGMAGFSIADRLDVWRGLDADICRAVAAATLGDAEKVRYFPYNSLQRFNALQVGDVDLLSRNTTVTLSRAASAGLSFAATTFFDGQGFLVPAKLGAKSGTDLNGATICISTGTTAETNVADYFRLHKMIYSPIVIPDIADFEAAFFSGRCDVMTGDASALASSRAAKAIHPQDYVILPERISKEPLAPVVRQNDEDWKKIVSWTIYALVEAEERGITQANVAQMKASKDPLIQRMLGVTPGMGRAMKLDDAWAYNVIAQVGNYGEIFERNVGEQSPLKLARGQNDLWSRGGLMYALPVR